MKFCKKCQQETERAAKDRCIPCNRKNNMASYARHKEKRLAEMRQHHAENLTAIRTRKKAYREANAEQISANKAADYLTNHEKELARRAAYRKANPERIRELSRQDMQRHPGRYRTNGLRRRFAEQQRVPAWVDMDAIRAIYAQCAEFRAAGIDVEVDHELPLRGKFVSGLHVPENLRIVPRFENRSKANRYAP